MIRDNLLIFITLKDPAMSVKLLPFFLFFSFLISGCAINPVTGEKEFNFVSQETELKIGAEQYAPSRQMQGGDYLTDPQVSAYVSSVGNRIAAFSDRKLPYEFKVINDSTPNAWALPGGKIAINRGLLVELQSEAELAAVLSHEIVHAAARHSAEGMERGMLMQGAVVAAGLAVGGTGYADYAVGGAGLAANLINQKYGREAESESDYYGMKYMVRAGYDPSAAVTLQETFVRLSEGKNSSWLEGLFSSHPPSRARVEANRRTLKEFPAGGEVGKDRYRVKIAPLLKNKEAYEQLDAGRKALKAGQIDAALSNAQKALAMEPRESLFHSLRGDVRFKQKRYQDAVINYDRALQRNNDFFLFYLQRGLANEKLGFYDRAYNDLEQSVKRLPTAPAMKALGDISQVRGNYQEAKAFYRTAAGSKTPVGKEAMASLVRLDLQDNPQNYLPVRLGLDNEKYLIAQIDNSTNEYVTEVIVAVEFTDARGRRQQAQYKVSKQIRPGERAVVNTGIGPNPQISNVKGRVVKARLVN
jgi:predicted Zn-dependent protease